MNNLVFVYIWEYKVEEDSFSDFLFNYGSNGIWQKFFSQSEAYIKTELLKQDENRNSFITIDYWKNKSEFHDFLKLHKKEYDKIDKECEILIEEENKIGEFELVD